MKIAHQAKTTITNFKSHATILLLGGTHAELIVQLTLLYLSAIVIELRWDDVFQFMIIFKFKKFISNEIQSWRSVLGFGSWVLGLLSGSIYKNKKNKKTKNSSQVVPALQINNLVQSRNHIQYICYRRYLAINFAIWYTSRYRFR